jgi:flagellar L-ring protein precursor FlgH
VFAFCIVMAAPAHGQTAKKKADPQKSNSSYEEIYQHYLQVARAATPAPDASVAWMAELAGDPRAHRVNDLVTVRVVESITASGKADSTVTKTSAATAAVPALFGMEKKLPGSIDPTKLASVGSDSKFTGAGATTRAGELTAVMTARVAEVLPNGDLVLEGAREIDINGDRQMVVLTGVVRPSDLAPNNTVLSTQVGQLSIRYFGNGLIKDSLKPGILVRLLNKIF